MTPHLQINYRQREKSTWNSLLAKILLPSPSLFLKTLTYELRHPEQRWENYSFYVIASRKPTENAAQSWATPRCCKLFNLNEKWKREKLGAATFRLSRITREKSTQRSILTSFTARCSETELHNLCEHKQSQLVSFTLVYLPTDTLGVRLSSKPLLSKWGQILFLACGAPTELRRWENIIFHLIERDGFLFTLQLRDFIITFRTNQTRGRVDRLDISGVCETNKSRMKSTRLFLSAFDGRYAQFIQNFVNEDSPSGVNYW